MSKDSSITEQMNDHISDIDDIEIEESYYKLWEDDRLQTVVTLVSFYLKYRQNMLMFHTHKEIRSVSI